MRASSAARRRGAGAAALRLDVGVAVQPGVVVVPQAARVEVDDLLERRQPAGDLEHLVDLLLVAGDHEARAAMLEHEGHLLGDRVLVERHRHRAADLRRDHRPVERAGGCGR